MIKRPHWYSSLKAKVTVLMVVLSMVAMGAFLVVFYGVENHLISEFKDEKVNLIENFVHSTLKPVMLTGQATLMPTLVESYKHLANIKEIKIVRTDGVEAFSDLKTIKVVNKNVGFKKFDRDVTTPARQVIDPQSEDFKKVILTGKKIVYEAEVGDGSKVITMMIPFRNEEACHICHGENHKIRGVMITSFSLSAMEQGTLEDVADSMEVMLATMLLLSLIAYLFFRRTIINPVTGIVSQINELVGKDRYDQRLDVSSDDEIGDLAIVFNSFLTTTEDFQHIQATEKDRLEAAVIEKTKELTEKNRIIEHDLQMAERVQQRLLPLILPDIPGFEFSASYNPCMYIGGDFYDIFKVDEKHLGVMMADATGHGPSAALLVSIVKTLMVGGAATKALSPSLLISQLNEYIALITPEDAFVTLFYGIIEIETGKMSYCLSGHPSPVIYNPETDELKSLELNGGLVGAFEESNFEDGEYTIQPGERIVVYTDGIVEAIDSSGKYYGIPRLNDVVKDNKSLDTKEILDKITESLVEYTDGAPLADDVTMVAVDYKRNAK